ncbi:MAG TPA: serine/threonine-protein kinase [Pyrinomonadaceae bacterium]|nr:serine/threonine-protein kinase [Pyrinomonadaceae bacterium]
MKYCTICKSKYEDSISFCPTDGEVLEDDPSSIVGTVLDGQYKIETLLGKGGMGAVYLARHILLGDRVAIKILPQEVRTNAEWLRRFRREGQAARRFRHANAVTVYDLRTAADGNIYMVMEYVEGHTLDAEIKQRGKFTAAESFEILEPIMSVLNTAHAMGVVHRDLKPENIMIGKATTGGEPTIKLLDLGIAKMREIAGVESSGTTELTMAGQVLGTPYYMSPEQWGELSRDGNLEIDGRADIYSLGLVIYEMITGRRAYSAATLHELRRDHVSVTPPPLVEKAPGVPRPFSDAIARAIAKDRVDRPATSGELANELREALANAPQLPVDRTVPDIPHVESSSSHTHGIRGAVSTKSDVNAPTIITLDSPATSPQRPAATPAIAEPIAAQEAAKRAAAGVDLGSSATAPRRQSPMEIPLAQERRRGKGLLIVGAAVLLVIVAIVGAGGIVAFSWFKSKPGTSAAAPAKKPNSSTVAPAATSDFGRYWLETLPNQLAAEPVRVAGAVPLKSGQAFKFHFEFLENGFVYVIGPGEQNQPTAFLTEKPAAISGLESNQVVKGDDFSFPSGLEHWLELDKKPGSENYTIIFSTQKLSAPAFLTQQATGKPLRDTEQTELRDFLNQHQTNTPVTELNDKDAAAPYVALKIPAAKDPGTPVIFEIRIQHK